MSENMERITISTMAEALRYRNEKVSDKHIEILSTAWDTKFGSLENCVIEGGNVNCKSMCKAKFRGAGKVYADEVIFSVFENCKEVQIGEYDEGYKAETSQFFNCGEITINEASVKDCIFNKFEILNLTNTTMKSCLVQNIVCENDCAICMEDGEISEVSFENIELRNDTYLIEGYGEPWVEDSVFLNIRTSRDDRELFHQEEIKGLIIKKKKEYCFVDEASCSGLDLVTVLKGNIDFNKFKNN